MSMRKQRIVSAVAGRDREASTPTPRPTLSALVAAAVLFKHPHAPLFGPVTVKSPSSPPSRSSKLYWHRGGRSIRFSMAIQDVIWSCEAMTAGGLPQQATFKTENAKIQETKGQKHLVVWW